MRIASEEIAESENIDINPYAFEMHNGHDGTGPVGVFRLPFARLTVWILAIGMPVGAAAVVLTDGAETNILALAIALLVAALIGAGWTAIAVSYFKVYVYSDRLRGCSFWGRYLDVKWEDIETITAWNFAGLKHLRVHIKRHGSSIWLPLFLNDMSQFTELVAHHAGPDNLLTRCLRVNLAQIK